MARHILRKMPAWLPVPAKSVETGEDVLAMQMHEAFSFHVPDVKDAAGVVTGHGGMVGGRANDYVVLWGGEFMACGMLEIVTVAAIEASRAVAPDDAKGEDGAAIALPRADEVPAAAPAG